MLKLVLDFLKVYWLDLVVVMLFIGVMLFLYKRKKIDLVKKIVLSLVVQAEKILGAGTGELKYNMVVEQLFVRLPVSVRWLITKREIDEMIDWAVEYLKEYLQGDRDLVGI